MTGYIAVAWCVVFAIALIGPGVWGAVGAAGGSGGPWLLWATPLRYAVEYLARLGIVLATLTAMAAFTAVFFVVPFILLFGRG